MTFKHCSSTSFILFMDVNILYCSFQNDFIVKTQKITTTNMNTPFLVKINKTTNMNLPNCRQTSQFADKHINLPTSISICRQTYQFADKHINLPTNISICRQIYRNCRQTIWLGGCGTPQYPPSVRPWLSRALIGRLC